MVALTKTPPPLLLLSSAHQSTNYHEAWLTRKAPLRNGVTTQTTDAASTSAITQKGNLSTLTLIGFSYL